MKGYHGPQGPALGLKSIWLSDVAFPFVNLKKERHFNFLRLVVFNCVYGGGRGGSKIPKCPLERQKYLTCLTCLACSRVSVSCVLTCQWTLRAYLLACQRAFHAHVLMFLMCSRAHMPTCIQ